MLTLKDRSRTLILLTLLAAFSTTIITGCGDDGKDETKDKTNKTRFAHTLNTTTPPNVLTVLNGDGAPLANATVLIGNKPGDPFNNNQTTTNAQGQFTAPAAWTAPLPVTITTAGSIPTTYTDLVPSGQNLLVQTVDPAGDIQIDGTATNFGTLKNDNKIHFALILPHFTHRMLAQFDMSMLLSPQSDDLSLVGRTIKVPSNLTLPLQHATYIFPITLEKPSFRTFVREAKMYSYVATHGQFPLTTVVNEIRSGKSIFQVLNYFDFIGAGNADVAVTDKGASQDISVNQVAFDTSFQVQAPTMDDDQLMVALALNEQNGSLYPTDLKRLNSQARMGLKTSTDKLDKYLLSMLKHEDDDNSMDFSQLSFALQKKTDAAPADTNPSITTPAFLPLIDAPTIKNDVLTTTPPAAVAGVTSMGTYIVLSEIETLGSGKVKTERRTRLYEIFTPGWATQVSLPSAPVVKNSQRTYRWEVLYLGRQGASTGDNLFDNVTHVTRNVVEI
jgi:hypothetical protein